MLLNRRIHSVIDGITGSAACADHADAAVPADETASVPPGGLVEWGKRNIVRLRYLREKWK